MRSPLSETDTFSSAHESSSQGAASSSQPPLPPAHVLVIEDDYAMARAVQMILLSRGYEVTVAHCGEDALDLMAQREPDLILLDVLLPDTEGYELLIKFVERCAVPLESVVMMSGLSSEADLKRARNAGICSYLQKPFTSSELVSTVNQCLTSRNIFRFQAQ